MKTTSCDKHTHTTYARPQRGGHAPLWQNAAAQNPAAVTPQNEETPAPLHSFLARSYTLSARQREPWLAAASPSARCSAPLCPRAQHRVQRRLARERVPDGTLHAGDQPTTSLRDPPAIQMAPLMLEPLWRVFRVNSEKSEQSRLEGKCLAIRFQKCMAWQHCDSGGWRADSAQLWVPIGIPNIHLTMDPLNLASPRMVEQFGSCNLLPEKGTRLGRTPTQSNTDAYDIRNACGCTLRSRQTPLWILCLQTFPVRRLAPMENPLVWFHVCVGFFLKHNT